jgi:hypothetical protein
MSVSFFHPELGPQDNPAGLAAAQAEPTPEPAPAETTPAPERKFAGKYNSAEALEQGYWESQREAMRIMAENEALKRQASQPQHPAPEPLAPLEDYGIPPHVIRAAIQAEVNATVERQVQDQFQKAFAPMVQGMSARASVARRYPDFETQAPKISEHIGSDPSLTERYNRLSASDPEMAMEWAYLEFARTAKPTTAAEPPNAGAIPKGGPAQRQVPGQDNREELDRARKYYEVMKDPRPYLRARFKDMIPDSHFEER